MRVLVLLGLLSLALLAGDDDDADARVVRRCAELSRRIEALLGPKFKRPVPVRRVDEAFVEKFARETEDKQIPKRVRAAVQKLAVRLRHVPPGYDMAEANIRLLREKVLGFYDPDNNRYFVVKGRTEPGDLRFDMTAAHELAHAYRDVDKDYWKRVRDGLIRDEDRAIAVSCLAEGDAELIGQSVALSARSEREVSEVVAGVVKTAKFAAANSEAAAADPDMRGYPLMLREMLITRYLIGMTFCAAVFERGGWLALQRAFDDPPRSTEQILHPEKYIGPELDPPTTFKGGDPAAALGEGWSTLYTNTMGEFVLRIHFTGILGRRRATRVSEGWDGARLHLCARDGQPLFFGLVSTWDSDADAAEFARAWADWASRRDNKDDPREVVAADPDLRVATKDGLVVVRQAGRDVLVLDGISLERVEAVAKALASSKREG